MDLIPLKKEEDQGGADVSLRQMRLSEEARRLARIQVAPVTRKVMETTTSLLGSVTYDESRYRTITSWMGGRIDHLYINTTGTEVERGQPMARIYSPELIAAQAELIQAVRARQRLDKSSLELVRKSARQTVASAREKLRLLGLSRSQIDTIVQRGTPAEHVTLFAPQAGIVLEKMVNEGEYVTTGTPVYTVADLSRVWVVLEAYEQDLPWIKTGATVRFKTKAHPGKTFSGRVTFIDPVVDPKTRTVDIRLEVPNPDRVLKPGMFVRAEHRPQPDKKQDAGELVIPESAPLLTGKRAVVYVAVPDREGTYEGREVVLGPRGDGVYVVRSGLREGEMVVTRGNFKIDSALQIMARPSMMTPGDSPPPSGHAGHDHGGTLAKDQSGAEPETAAFAVPALFASKLRILADRARKTTEAVDSGHLERARQSFAALKDFLVSVDGSGLEGDAALHWKELSMLLTNDAVLGAEADTMDRMTRVEAEFQNHFQRLTRTFPVPSESSRFMAPMKFQAQLGAVYLHYSAIMEALAADDFKAAVQVLPDLETAVAGVDMALLDHVRHELWMEKLALIRQGIDQLKAASNIVDGRIGFEPLSVGLTDAIMALGIIVDGPLYEMSCPMAFENKGATWLQQDQDLRNPYFGEAMYRCGEIKRQLKER
jgi:Cu(I)/Ag(I) efflux system membrane fusion protein